MLAVILDISDILKHNVHYEMLLEGVMNKLQKEKRAQILSVLCEGMGINAATRITGVSKNTVLKLLADAGEACALYQDPVMRNLNCKRVECDEIWSFVGMKQKNVPE